MPKVTLKTTPLRIERKRRGLLALEVAQSLKIDQSYYSKIELGKLAPSPEVAEKIALHFGHAVTEMQILYPERYPVQTGEAA